MQKVGHLVFFSRACAALVLWLFAVPALAGAIALDAGTRSVEAWPALRVLADPSGVMSAREALARRADFAAPAGPYANLGPRTEPVWILLICAAPPTRRANGCSRWITRRSTASRSTPRPLPAPRRC